MSLPINPVLLADVLQSLGPLAEPPALLVGLVALAVVLIVGRVVLAFAWRVVLLAIAVLFVLWILGIMGFQTGILSQLELMAIVG